MKIKEMKKITDQHHLNLFSMSYLDQRDQEKSWVFASRKKVPEVADKKPPAADAVVIVPFHQEQQKLVMIREFRVPLGGISIWISRRPGGPRRNRGKGRGKGTQRGNRP